MIGNAPESLARNAPIRALLDHFVDSLFAPGGNPLHAMNFFERFRAQCFFLPVGCLIHFDEPLLGGAENHRIVAPPAVRVTVDIAVIREKRSALIKQFDDDRIRFKHIFAFVLRQSLEIDPLSSIGA